MQCYIMDSQPALVADALFLIQHSDTPSICTLSLHDALPISTPTTGDRSSGPKLGSMRRKSRRYGSQTSRSEEHTSELQSRQYLVCRLLLEKKKITRLM